MTQLEFMDSLQEQWKSLSDERLKNYNRKVRQFSDSERKSIWNYLLENYTKQSTPQIADIVEAARELMIPSVRAPTRCSITHAWEPSDCPTCRGEGRVQVWFSVWVKDAKRYDRPERQLPYSHLPPEDLLKESNFFSSIARCYCPAGDLQTLGDKWPRLKAPIGRSESLDPQLSKPEPAAKIPDLDKAARQLERQFSFSGSRRVDRR